MAKTQCPHWLSPISQPSRSKSFIFRRINLDYSQIGSRVEPITLASCKISRWLIFELDTNTVSGPIHHVKIGDDKAVGIQDHA